MSVLLLLLPTIAVTVLLCASGVATGGALPLQRWCSYGNYTSSAFTCLMNSTCTVWGQNFMHGMDSGRDSGDCVLRTGMPHPLAEVRGPFGTSLPEEHATSS